mgnify:CR=1 FL=1
MTTIYGIKNCDTMKKALYWLDEHNIEYRFHDYKKEGLDEDAVKKAIKEHGWEAVINKRGTTWRNLPPAVQDNMDKLKAVNIAEDNPSIVKRPLLIHKDKTYLGFKDVQYADIFKT